MRTPEQPTPEGIVPQQKFIDDLTLPEDLNAGMRRAVRDYATFIDRNPSLTIDERRALLTDRVYCYGNFRSKANPLTLEQTANTLGISEADVKRHLGLVEESEKLIAAALLTDGMINMAELPETSIAALESRCLALLVDPVERQIAMLSFEGKDVPEISEALHKGQSYIRRLRKRAREKFDKEVLGPAGFKRVIDFPEKRKLTNAANRGTLVSEHFMGALYTSDSAVDDYQELQTRGDANLLDDGYVPITQHATVYEYRALKTKHPTLLRVVGGVNYIKRKTLNRFRRVFVPPILPPESPAAVARTYSEWSLLRTAIVRGMVPGEKVNNEWRVSDIAIARKFLDSVPKTLRAKGRKPIIVFDAKQHMEDQEDSTPQS